MHKSNKPLPDFSIRSESRTMRELYDILGRYTGMSVDSISEFLNTTSTLVENGLMHMAESMLEACGYDRNKFEDACLTLQVLEIDAYGNLLDYTSVCNIPYNEIGKQEWGESPLYRIMKSRLLFMVFQESSDRSDYYFRGVTSILPSEIERILMYDAWQEAKELTHSNYFLREFAVHDFSLNEDYLRDRILKPFLMTQSGISENPQRSL